MSIRILSDNTKMWYKDGQLHREDGPAIECPDGTQYYYIDGELHRIDGPAVIYPNGKRSWFLNGIGYYEEHWKELIKLQK